jgi:hypothetical protein
MVPDHILISHNLARLNDGRFTGFQYLRAGFLLMLLYVLKYLLLAHTNPFTMASVINFVISVAGVPWGTEIRIFSESNCRFRKEEGRVSESFRATSRPVLPAAFRTVAGIRIFIWSM